MTALSSIDTSSLDALERHIRERLAQGIAPKLAPVFSDIHEEITNFARGDQVIANARVHAELAARYCTAQVDEIARMTEVEQGFQTRLANAVDNAEERAAIMDFARELGSKGKQFQRDRKALDAYFDPDAVIERFHKRVGERERALAHGLERLGVIAADAALEDPLMVDSAFFIELSETLLTEMRSWRGDARVRAAAHRCLGSIAERIDRWPFGYWFETKLSATRRVAMDESEDVWVQCSAFDTLLALSPKSMANAISSRISQPMSQKKPQVRDSELFLRRHLVRLVCTNYLMNDAFPRILAQLIGDESGAVRQVVADCVHLLPEQAAAEIFALARADEDPQVRAILFADVARIAPVISARGYEFHIAQTLAKDSDEFVLRIALDAAAGLAAFARSSELPDREQIFEGLKAAFVEFQSRKLSPKLLRWADEVYERIWLLSDPDALEIAEILRATTLDQREAEIRSIKALKPWLSGQSDTVGRVMAVLAQQDFGLSLHKGVIPRIQRGEWIKRRLWRFLFEGGNPATDKRQAFTHTTGRHYFGTIIAPSARMAELAPTKVPGEPLVESSEGGWRNYIPLVDQVLAALDHGKALEIFTSAGITELTPPSGLVSRLRGFWRISRDFAELADERNRDPSAYLQSLQAYGLAASFRGYEEGEQPNPHVVKFFSAGEGTP